MPESEYLVIHHLHDDMVVRALNKISSMVGVTSANIEAEMEKEVGARSLVSKLRFNLEELTEGQRTALANSVAYPIKPNGTVDMKKQVRLPSYIK